MKDKLITLPPTPSAVHVQLSYEQTADMLEGALHRHIRGTFSYRGVAEALAAEGWSIMPAMTFQVACSTAECAKVPDER